MNKLKSGQQKAKEMTDLLNTFNNNNAKDFINEMSKEHRTLQQKFTKEIVFGWILANANNSYDARNEVSVKACQKIVEAVGEDTLKAIPFI